MNDLPIKKLQGIGKVTEMIMHGLGIFTCADLILKASEIYLNFTENVFEFLIKSGLGVGKTLHDPSAQLTIKKSLSVAESFKPVNNFDELMAKVKVLAKELANKCKVECLMARTLTLEYKTFKLINK